MNQWRKDRIKGQHLLSRLGGFSSPLGGVSLRLPESERDVVRGVIIYLEDRRVLYVDMILEIPEQVTGSLLEIRKELTSAMKRVAANSPAAKSFEAMRAECRRFLSEPPPQFPNIGMASDTGSHRGMDAGFFANLGRLRSAFGQQLAELAYLYDLDLSDELASILPAIPKIDDEDAPERRYWRY